MYIPSNYNLGEILNFNEPDSWDNKQDSLEWELYLTRQLVLCKHGVLRGSNCCRDYVPKNYLYITRCCCLYCAHSIWLGDEKSARNPFAALQGDPMFAVEVIRERSPG